MSEPLTVVAFHLGADGGYVHGVLVWLLFPVSDYSLFYVPDLAFSVLEVQDCFHPALQCARGFRLHPNYVPEHVIIEGFLEVWEVGVVGFVRSCYGE